MTAAELESGARVDGLIDQSQPLARMLYQYNNSTQPNDE